MSVEKNVGSFPVIVNASINRICDDLGLIAFVRTKCIELSGKIAPKQLADITKPIANAIACAIVSIVNEESKRNGRVGKHLPDRIIGSVFGLNGVSVVYNKRLINSVIAGDSSKLGNITG
jgi:hypothetical protein